MKNLVMTILVAIVYLTPGRLAGGVAQGPSHGGRVYLGPGVEYSLYVN